MKKKIIICLIAVVLVIALVFGISFAVKSYKRNSMNKFALVVSEYFEAAKVGNNELMNIAAIYEGYGDWGVIEDADEAAGELLGIYKGLSFEAGKAYDAVMSYNIGYDEATEIIDIVKAHREQYLKFEENILNYADGNYNPDFGRNYKEWQMPFADEHHRLRNILAKYR